MTTNEGRSRMPSRKDVVTVVSRVRRWHADRCAVCGHRFRWREGRYSNGPGTGPQHQPCWSSLHWARIADERMAVLDVVTETWSVSGETVRELLALRYPDPVKHDGWNLAWRVFRDLDERRDVSA